MKKKNTIHVAIIAANFYPDITQKLIDGALATLQEAAVVKKNIMIQLVPGCFELPLACQRALQQKTYDAAIVLGCALQGETDHYAAIMNGTTQGIMDVMLRANKPVGFGVIFAHNRAQALARCQGTKNYGSGAARSVLAIVTT